MQTASRKYIFFKIHAANFLLAYYLSFSKTVMVYELLVPSFLCGRFKRFDPEDYVDWDAWSSIRELAYEQWKGIMGVLRNRIWRINILGHRTDFTTIAMEVLGKEYEKLFVLVKLMERSKNESTYLVEPGLSRFMGNGFSSDLVKRSDINVKLDYVYEMVLNLLHFARFFWTVIKLAISACEKTLHMDYDFFWSGINPSEQNTGPNKLDFAWAVERKIFSAEKILYFLPARLSDEARSVYQSRHVCYREPGHYFDDLRGRKAIRIVRDLFLSLSTSNVGILTPYHGQLLFRFVCQAILWAVLAKHHKIEIAFTTQGAVWPERPEVAVLNAMGIRTVTWSYSANYMLYRTKRKIGSDPQAALSALETKEFYVWNKLSSDWIHSRLLHEKKPDIKVIGPLMSGDSRICLESPEDARAFLGIEEEEGCVYISVYDMPTISKETRLKSCLGPSPYPEEMVTAFYEDIKKLSEACPKFIFILKPKRSFDEKTVVYSREIREFYEMGRVIYMEYDVNPYVPIAASDVCLAMPFTSPVLAGLHFGRIGVYHDPLNLIKSHLYHGLDMMIAHGYNDLERELRFWISQEGKDQFQELLRKGAIKAFADRSDVLDPAECFAKAVFNTGPCPRKKPEDSHVFRSMV